jgi:hypothetical protein
LRNCRTQKTQNDFPPASRVYSIQCCKMIPTIFHPPCCKMIPSNKHSQALTKSSN